MDVLVSVKVETVSVILHQIFSMHVCLFFRQSDVRYFHAQTSVWRFVCFQSSVWVSHMKQMNWNFGLFTIESKAFFFFTDNDFNC